MSADNGIYILKTPTSDGYEYRVRELQAVENVFWDDSIADDTDNLDVLIANARRMWNGVKVFTKEGKALEEAASQLRNCYICEYGISFITIDRQF